MIKFKGNFALAQQEFANDTNNSVAYIYSQSNNNITSGSGKLAQAVFSVKDNFATKDAPTQASSASLKNFQPHYNATILDKLYQEGAVIVGKVHCDELALGGEGIYSHWGIIKNPLDHTKKVGGSSSGSAATFTKNISFAIGSDTGDSVRLPASFIGKVGFKPSYGAISRYGLFAYASSLDTVAYFTHCVADSIIISQTVYGVDEKDFTSKEVKIANVEKKQPHKVAFFKIEHLLTDFVIKNYNDLKEKLVSNGTQVFEIALDETLMQAIKPVYDIISYSEVSSNLATINGVAFGQRSIEKKWKTMMTQTRSQGFGFMVQRRLILGSFFLNLENQKELFLRAQKIRRLIKNYFTEIYSKYDLVIFPSYADVAPSLEEKSNSFGFMNHILTNANLVGNPSISIPWIHDSNQNNLPINLNLDAALYEDEKLLSYALWIEDFLGGKHES